MESEFVTIQDRNEPSFTRTVSLRSFNGWPKSKDVEGARLAQGGRRTMVIVSDEQAQAERVKSPIRIPEVVERTMAAKAEPAPEAPAEVVAEVAPDPVVAEVPAPIAPPKPAPAKSSKGKK
jgi:hypothetical protein